MEDYPELNLEFMKENGIELIQCGVTGNNVFRYILYNKLMHNRNHLF